VKEEIRKGRMSKKLDQILVIDVESTCWKGNPPPGQTNEIIEIGITLLNIKELQIMETLSILVKPERSEISQFCTELTTLTEAQIETGITFQEACNRLKNDFNAKERTWASYGDYDRRQFERQCRELSIAYPFGPTHINIKNLLSIFEGLTSELGMIDALNHLKLEHTGTHHRGADDSRNIATILMSLIGKQRRD
jgi:inhibitor of KinA sporulation pathway (predicted exonuclease)